MNELKIDRCACFQVSFARIDLWATAQTELIEVCDVTEKFGCGSRCKLCLPYIACTLRTGQVVFSEILNEPLKQ